MEWLFFDLLFVLIGLAGGLAVGSGLVALLVMLDLIPRLAQITRSYGSIHSYEGAVVIGTLFWTNLDFYNANLSLSPLITSVIGVFAGTFVGMLAAALTEVLNVLPILAKRMRMGDFILWMLMAMVFGKVTGSLFEWLIGAK